MIKKPLVSIIMPAYNVEKYIREAIDSVINQTYLNWELIVIDDGSMDGTGMIVDEYANSDQRIRVIHTENNGVSAARNIGLNVCKGEWIALIDSDDAYPINAIENLVNGIDDCDLVIGNYETFPNKYQFSTVDDKTYEMFGEGKRDFFDMIQRDEFSLFCAVWGKIYSRKCIKYLFNPAYSNTKNYNSDDIMFNLQNFTEYRRIHTIKEVTYLYRREDMNSLSRRCGSLFYYNDFFEELNMLREKGYFNELFMYSWYAHEIVVHVKKIYRNMNVDLAHYHIQELLQNEYFNKVPLNQYKLKPSEAHKWLILKTKDMDLIEREFRK